MKFGVIAPSYSAIFSWRTNGINLWTGSRPKGTEFMLIRLPTQSRDLSYPHIHSYPQKKEEKEKSSKKEKEERKARRLDLSKAPNSIYEGAGLRRSRK
jgi:hypothetical protein